MYFFKPPAKLYYMKKIIGYGFLMFLVLTSSYAAKRNYFQHTTFYDLDTDKPVSYGTEYYDNQEEDCVFCRSFEDWFNGPYVFGGNHGIRKAAEDNGMFLNLTYLGNFAANPVGGNSRGASNTSNLNLGLDIDLQKITGIDELSGWGIANTWVYRFGQSLTKDYIDNTFNVQQNYGSQTMQLQSLFMRYDKKFAGDEWRFFLKFGRIAAGDNFMSKPIYWLYQNNAFDGNPVGVFNQTKWSAYPGSTWGAMSMVKYEDGQYFKAGVYQINTDRQDSMQGLDWSFHGRGVNATFEGGWDINHDDSGKSPGNISAGLVADWYDAEYKDGSGRTDTFNYTVYIQADYMVWNLGQVKTAKPRYIVRKGDRYRDLRGIVLWGAVQYNPNDDVAYMPFFANGGVLFNAPFKSRADDVLCFGIAYGKYSGKLRDYEKNSYEMVLELNYKIQVNRFMFVQPNIQGIINPKGGKYSDAMVLGIQFGFNL